MRATGKAGNRKQAWEWEMVLYKQRQERERDLGLIESLFTTITRDDLQLTVILFTN